MGYGWRDEERAFINGSILAQQSAYTEAMGNWIGDLGPWHYFVTLTFDAAQLQTVGRSTAFRRPPLPPAVSTWAAQRRFAAFLRRAPKTLGRPAEGVVALELHKSGQPHGHGLLKVSDGRYQGDIRELSGDWRGLAGNGYIRIEIPKSSDDVSGYCAKYMTKDAGHLVFSSGFPG
jgi:hypothetical protein